MYSFHILGDFQIHFPNGDKAAGAAHLQLEPVVGLIVYSQ